MPNANELDFPHKLPKSLKRAVFEIFHITPKDEEADRLKAIEWIVGIKPIVFEDLTAILQITVDIEKLRPNTLLRAEELILKELGRDVKEGRG